MAASFRGKLLRQQALVGYQSAMDQAAKPLTEAEKEALRLYLQTSDPKEIGRRIDRTHHAVEQRLERARRKLGVSRTLDAALMLAREEGAAWEGAPYPSSPHVPVTDAPPIQVPTGDGGWVTWLPFPTKGRPWNDLPSWARLAWMGFGTLVLALSTLAVVGMGEAISRIVRQLR